MADSKWRLAATLTLLLTAVPVLAGCVGTASAASAMEAQSPADSAATAWSADAQLAQVVGVEGTFPLAALAMMGGYGNYGSSSDYEKAESDETVGDGLAKAWVYRYLSDDKDASYVVVVDNEGDVLRKAEERRSDDDRVLAAWTIDSDEAVTRALEANAGLKQGVESDQYGFISVLSQRDGDSPTWFIAGGGGGMTGGGGGFVIIDAVSGAVLDSQGGFASR